MSDKVKIGFVINSLSTGGAQMMLLRLVQSLDLERIHPVIYSLLPLNDFKHAVKNIEVKYLLSSKAEFLRCPKMLEKNIRDDEVRTLMSWMYYSDLVSSIVKTKVPQLRLIWNIRHGNLSPKYNKLTTILTARTCALKYISLVDDIIYCSESSRKYHIKFGYNHTNVHVINNGYDLTTFHPDKEQNSVLKSNLNIPMNSVIIGHVARFDPLKDHSTFIKATSKVINYFPNVHIVMCGEGIDPGNSKIYDLIKDSRLEKNYHLLGKRQDINKITQAFDVAVVSSKAEGFSNTLCEAMACAIPCISTDVGDSKNLIDNNNLIVPPGNTEKFANAIIYLLNKKESERIEIGNKMMNIISRNFSIDVVTKKYENIILGI